MCAQTDVGYQSDYIVLIIANISTRTIGQEVHPLGSHNLLSEYMFEMGVSTSLFSAEMLV
jgi:hypothetical protein